MKMKILLLLLLYLALILNTSIAQFTPDSCLKLLQPPEDWDEYYKGIFNPDSVKGDSCIYSPTFGQFYSKQAYHMIFFHNYLNPKIVPLDSIVDKNIISNENPYIKSKFEELANKYGEYYFLRDTLLIIDSGFAQIPEFYLSFNNYVCIDSVVQDINSILFDSISCYYERPMRYDLIGINENKLFNQKDYDIKYLPSQRKIIITNNDMTHSESLSIYNLYGIKIDSYNLKSNDKFINIPVDNFANGIYFIKISNFIQKVMIY